MQRPTRPILLTRPWITQEDIDAVTQAARDGWGERSSFHQGLFEEDFAFYLGRKHAVATSTGTAALHLALLALNIGKGDEVIVPDSTWAATAAAVVYTGATPIFADIEPDTWCLDVRSVIPHLGPKTKAIILVDLYGNPPRDLCAIRNLCREWDLPLIEDAAQAIGAIHPTTNTLAGTFGDISCFSFHGSKTLTTGEGGMLVTDNDDYYLRARLFQNHGSINADRKMLITRVVGQKYRMSAMQAALGASQLKRVRSLVNRKIEIASMYRKHLLVPNIEGSSYWMPTVFLSLRDTTMSWLEDHGIDSRPFFPPLTTTTPYRDYTPGNPVAYRLGPTGLNLPCGADLTEDEITYICEVIESAKALD